MGGVFIYKYDINFDKLLLFNKAKKEQKERDKKEQKEIKEHIGTIARFFKNHRNKKSN